MTACNHTANNRKWNVAGRSQVQARSLESRNGRAAEPGRIQWSGCPGKSRGGREIDERTARPKSSQGARGTAFSRTARDRVCAPGNRSQPFAIVCRGRLGPRGENLTGFVRQRKTVYVRRKNAKSHYSQGAIHRFSQNRRMAQESAGDVVLPELHHPRRGYSRQFVSPSQASEPWVHPHPDVCRESNL
jgi:hypothetical protein